MKVKSLKRKVHKRRGVTNKDPILTEASFKQLIYIDSLLETSNFNQKTYEHYYERFKRFISEGQADKFIIMLEENQRCNINGGFNYQLTDITEKLNIEI